MAYDNGTAAIYREPMPPRKSCTSYHVYKILSIIYAVVFFVSIDFTSILYYRPTSVVVFLLSVQRCFVFARSGVSIQIKSNGVLLTCDQKLTDSQFNPIHTRKQKDNGKLKKPLSNTESVKASGRVMVIVCCLPSPVGREIKNKTHQRMSQRETGKRIECRNRIRPLRGKLLLYLIDLRVASAMLFVWMDSP